MNIGKIGSYKINKITDIGAYLDVSGINILLPKKQLPKDASIGDEITVFVYKDSKSRPIATTKMPLLTVGDIARLKVVDFNKDGYFLDIGLERDLFLPKSESMKELNIGDYVKVLMYVDKSDRLCASMYTKKNFKNKNGDIIIKRLLDNNNVKTEQYILSSKKVYKIIKEKFGGHLLYDDKSATPAIIKKDFNMSKAEFKRSIGKLLKDKMIKITDLGIYTY